MLSELKLFVAAVTGARFEGHDTAYVAVIKNLVESFFLNGMDSNDFKLVFGEQTTCDLNLPLSNSGIREHFRQRIRAQESIQFSIARLEAVLRCPLAPSCPEARR